jgi:hypothetical protein
LWPLVLRASRRQRCKPIPRISSLKREMRCLQLVGLDPQRKVLMDGWWRRVRYSQAPRNAPTRALVRGGRESHRGS